MLQLKDIPGRPNEEEKSEAETFFSIRFFPKIGRCFPLLLLKALPTPHTFLNLFEGRHKAFFHTLFFELLGGCKNLLHIPIPAMALLEE